MLTVKLKRSNAGGSLFSTKIIEAEEVDIHVIQVGHLATLTGRCVDRTFTFHIMKEGMPIPEGLTDNTDIWSSAFIENASGVTTDIVRFLK